MDSALKNLNLYQSKYDSCVYSYYTCNKCILIAIFADDLIVLTDSVDFLATLKNGLQRICTLKDLGPLKKCLGINIHQNKVKGTIELEQSDYIESILANFGMKDCRHTSTPIDPEGRMEAVHLGQPSTLTRYHTKTL